MGLLMPERMKLFGSTIDKKTKNKNAENVPNLEITYKQYYSIVILPTIIVNLIQEFCMHLFQMDHLINY